ncbi:putative protein phosphatase 2C [Trypanosoma grayi]|uniref:putative protein phosphatase 2C n=1 Tax=Trypanosoma grayi TaxID=71804 RepID=UPI0004F3F7DB|nr:putative protein phosphatase 2C [Trypanosoma grayi]KEG15400.1 putative protein phosphatase 2C [Trypanosoma grayi]
MCVTYWAATRFGPLTALLLLAFLWLLGALNLLEHLFRFVAVTGDEADYHDLLRRADIMHQPNVQKVSKRGENPWLSYGFSCMQGWRRTMEDDHVAMLCDGGGFFGVFDGHSGSSAAKFCGGNIFNFISKTQAFAEKNYQKALYDGFISIDQHLHTNHGNERSGCTAVVLLVTDDELYCGNAGDSRSVLCRDGDPVALSSDHKPFLPGEQSRIERAGGYVWNRRVNGALALSRAIGDFSFKCNTQVSWDQQAVTSAPEVRFVRLNRDRDEFAVIACDGIWDVMSNEQVVEFVRLRVQRRLPLDQIAEELIERCLSPQPFGLGCDNMSVVIVQFKRTVPSRSRPKDLQEGESDVIEPVIVEGEAMQPSPIDCDETKAFQNGSLGGGSTTTKNENYLVKQLQQQQQQSLLKGKGEGLEDFLDDQTGSAELALPRDAINAPPCEEERGPDPKAKWE